MIYIREVNYYQYSKEDILQTCPQCGSDMVDAPELVHELDLTENQRLDFEVGDWTIAYCPNCFLVNIYTPPK